MLLFITQLRYLLLFRTPPRSLLCYLQWGR